VQSRGPWRLLEGPPPKPIRRTAGAGYGGRGRAQCGDACWWGQSSLARTLFWAGCDISMAGAVVLGSISHGSQPGLARQGLQLALPTRILTPTPPIPSQAHRSASQPWRRQQQRRRRPQQQQRRSLAAAANSSSGEQQQRRTAAAAIAYFGEREGGEKGGRVREMEREGEREEGRGRGKGRAAAEGAGVMARVWGDSGPMSLSQDATPHLSGTL
jgi:hypothetical protein